MLPRTGRPDLRFCGFAVHTQSVSQRFAWGLWASVSELPP